MRILAVALLFLSLTLGGMTGCAQKSAVTTNMFEAAIEPLSEVKAGTPFQVVGYITNTSSTTLEITHGARMFTYELVDADGNTVPAKEKLLYSNDIGYRTSIKAGGTYRNNAEDQRSRAFFEFELGQPGTYQVKAIVKFQIQSNGDVREIQLESEPYSFTVGD